MTNKKPIEKIYVCWSGDRSVGIDPHSYELGCYITRHPDDADELKENKKAVSELYELLEGEAPEYVTYDFELEEQNAAEKRMEEEQAKYEAEEERLRMEELSKLEHRDDKL